MLDQSPPDALSNRPIFLQGILQRCGTNFLHHLLLLHPGLHGCGPIYEDFLLRPSDLLVQYAEAVYGCYPGFWGIREKAGGPETLLQSIGEGLLAWLRRSVEPEVARTKRLLTKTPCVQNLRRIYALFPDAQVLILVRNCRAVVESGVRSFNWEYEAAMQRWANNAREILAFIEQESEHPERWMLVRYEDLYSRTEETLRAIFQHLHLPEAAYDFAAAQNLPVIGSSEGRAEDGRFQFKEIEKTKTFDPANRGAAWDEEKIDLLQCIAGDCMEQLGYGETTGLKTEG